MKIVSYNIEKCSNIAEIEIDQYIESLNDRD